VSHLRHNPKRDQNEKIIVDALEAVGAHCWRLHTPCDLLVFRLGKLYTLEVKAGTRRRKDQPEQTEFLRVTNTPIVTNAEEALRAVGAIR